jgi:hypothetical protein
MRKLFVALFAILFFVGSSASLIAVAQDDATPEAEGEAAEGSNPVDPAIGDTVTYYGQNGDPVGMITVTGITRNWEDYGEYEEPDPGIEYISFTIEVESVTARGAIDIDPYDFRLQSPSGFIYGNAYAQGAEGVEPEILTESVSLAGGENLEAQVIFEVFEGEELAHLFWSPESETFLTVAQLEGE